MMSKKSLFDYVLPQYLRDNGQRGLLSLSQFTI